MSMPKEPEVKHEDVPVRNFWKQDQPKGYRRVSSGPLPTIDELPPVEPGKDVGVDEDETEGSPSFPGTPKQLPPKQKGVDLDK